MDDLYGGKCHLCAHLLGPTHRVDEIESLGLNHPVWGRCADCKFCQEEALLKALEASDPCPPEVIQIAKDLFGPRAERRLKMMGIDEAATAD